MQSSVIEVAGSQLAASHWPATKPAEPANPAEPAIPAEPADPATPADRVIVLLHAGVCDRRSWYRTAEQLTDLGLLIAYDRRGFGDSPASAGPYRDLDDLWAVIDQVTGPSEPAKRNPVWLVGSSMGGLLALDAALTSPERVAGLVLLAPAISGAPEDDEKLDPESEAIFDQLGDAREAGDRQRRLQLHAQLWLDGPAATGRRVTGEARDLALAMNEIILRNDVDEEAGEAGVDAWSRLEQIRIPATVAWGDLDVPLIIDTCEQLAARLPLARRRVLAGTAHLPYLEQPDLVADVIRQALD